ncbi:MAG: division/cell wall cluster transcriptional repressor MraZ [Desulfobacterales bacterium]|nr:division/cell wall cluster transcriptional repressor MraZ [Desulfobacterales bacterium]
MFRGSSFHTIDAKGRIIIPTRFRDVIKAGGGDGVMVSRMDQCLVAYTLEEWRKIEARILDLAEKNDSMRRFRRVFVGGAFECLCDRQERTLIPPTLRQYAELDKEIVMVGVLDHFEIWSRDRWDQENQHMEEDMKQEDVRNEIAKLGL